MRSVSLPVFWKDCWGFYFSIIHRQNYSWVIQHVTGDLMSSLFLGWPIVWIQTYNKIKQKMDELYYLAVTLPFLSKPNCPYNRLSRCQLYDPCLVYIESYKKGLTRAVPLLTFLPPRENWNIACCHVAIKPPFLLPFTILSWEHGTSFCPLFTWGQEAEVLASCISKNPGLAEVKSCLIFPQRRQASPSIELSDY